MITSELLRFVLVKYTIKLIGFTLDLTLLRQSC